MSKHTDIIRTSIENIYKNIPDIDPYTVMHNDFKSFCDTLSYSAPEIMHYRWQQCIQMLNKYISNIENHNIEIWMNEINKIVSECNSQLITI